MQHLLLILGSDKYPHLKFFTCKNPSVLFLRVTRESYFSQTSAAALKSLLVAGVGDRKQDQRKWQAGVSG